MSRLNGELVKTATSKEIVDAIEEVGYETSTSTTEEFAQMIKTDWPKWNDRVKASGAKAH